MTMQPYELGDTELTGDQREAFERMIDMIGTVRETVGGLARHAGVGPVRKAGCRERHDDRCDESKEGGPGFGGRAVDRAGPC